MIRRLIGRQNRHGWPVARIRFAKNLAGSPQELFASLSAKWLRRSSPRSIRVIKQSRTEMVGGSRNAVAVFSRESGYDFRWSDLYCQNLFVRGCSTNSPVTLLGKAGEQAQSKPGFIDHAGS